MKTQLEVNVNGFPLLLTTTNLCELTGLSRIQLRKFVDAGLLEPVQLSAHKHKFWRRDEALIALGFSPVCK